MIINGQKHTLTDIQHETTLLRYLREYVGLTRAKLGCDVGDCGTCTVIVDGKPINSCLMLAVRAADSEIETIEGLATAERLHPIQESFEELGALQCGCCGPGLIMMAKNLLVHDSNPTRDKIKNHLAGNLCRCTGYTKIIEAIENVICINN